MNKVCTSIEQSKKLAEILPLESADMYYEKRCNLPEVIVGNYSLHMQCRATDKDYKKLTYPVLSPCWSLAALFGILPDESKDNHFLTLQKEKNEYCCCYEDINGNSFRHTFADNPIDVCYEMIIKLKELNLL